MSVSQAVLEKLRLLNQLAEESYMCKKCDCEKTPERRPFDLEAAKRGEPIVHKNGGSIAFIAYVPEAKDSERVVLRKGDRIAIVNEKGIAHGFDYPNYFMAPKAPRKERRILRLMEKPEGGTYVAMGRLAMSHAKVIGSAVVEVEEGKFACEGPSNL